MDFAPLLLLHPSFWLDLDVRSFRIQPELCRWYMWWSSALVECNVLVIYQYQRQASIILQCPELSVLNDQLMLALLVRNSKILQSTGVSFAVLGTTMHVLNVANLMSPTLSHTWSAIAILGFCLTASSQIRGTIIGKIFWIKRQKTATSNNTTSNERNDVVLP
jgi:hypothetical protein